MATAGTTPTGHATEHAPAPAGNRSITPPLETVRAPPKRLNARTLNASLLDSTAIHRPLPLSRFCLPALAAVCLALATGCAHGPRRAAELRAPWAPAASRTLAVAPLLNESGNAHADGVRMADRLTERLNGADGVSTIPVNRVLAEMERLGLSEVRTDGQARELRAGLGVDGLVAGTITAFDPYDPPKVGLNLGVFYAGPPAPPPDPARSTGPRAEGAPDLRAMSRSATQVAEPEPAPTPGPVAAISRVYDAADPATQDRLGRFARDRGIDYARSETDRRLFRISSDLFAGFVAHEAAGDLLQASSF